MITSLFSPEMYVGEFSEFLPEVAWSDRNPLNTEMFFLWCMIRTTKPALFIESGTFRGYSANFACEALKRNDNGAEFITYGYDLDDCLAAARERLAKYSFATVVEGDSVAHIRARQSDGRLAAFFIDGPKGRNLPPLFYAITARFPNIAFVSIHDCQRESGSRNRSLTEAFYRGQYRVTYCDAAFQERYTDLDNPLIGKSELVDWKPYHWNGRKQESYGTETAYALTGQARLGTALSRTCWRMLRWWRLGLGLPLASGIRRVVGRSQ